MKRALNLLLCLLVTAGLLTACTSTVNFSTTVTAVSDELEADAREGTGSDYAAFLTAYPYWHCVNPDMTWSFSADGKCSFRYAADPEDSTSVEELYTGDWYLINTDTATTIHVTLSDSSRADYTVVFNDDGSIAVSDTDFHTYRMVPTDENGEAYVEEEEAEEGGEIDSVD